MMTSIWGAITAFGLLTGGGAAPARPPTLEDLAFLAGSWSSEEPDESMREVWDPPRGDAMVGHFSIVSEGRAVLYELMAVESGEEGLTMRIRHFGPGLTPWASEASGPLSLRLIEAGEGRAVFEDPDRDFPRRVEYVRTGQGLTVSLVGAEGSEREAILLRLTRE